MQISLDMETILTTSLMNIIYLKKWQPSKNNFSRRFSLFTRHSQLLKKTIRGLSDRKIIVADFLQI